MLTIEAISHSGDRIVWAEQRKAKPGPPAYFHFRATYREEATCVARNAAHRTNLGLVSVSYFFCNSFSLSRITWPTIPRFFALILSIVSCGVCQYPAEFTRSMMSADGTPRDRNER